MDGFNAISARASASSITASAASASFEPGTSTMAQNQVHRAGIHDPEVLVSAVEDDVCTLDAPVIQLSLVIRNFRS
jgi:hypothetical protein